MRKVIALLFSLCIFFSCSKVEFNYNILETKEKKIIKVKNFSSHLISIILEKNEDEQQILHMIKQILSSYPDKSKKLKSPKEIKYSNPYLLFFQIRDFYYDDLKNLALKYGLIENEWLNFSDRYFQNEGKKFFRVEELDSFILEKKLSKAEISELYKFTVNFLLSETLFVSIQELFERPYRYFNLNELETFFSRVVIIPEAKELTEFLVKKYGKDKIIKFARMNYSKESWKKTFGEPVNEIEEEFAKSIERYRFSSFFYGKEGEKLKNLLSIYNKNTKNTLFKKQ